MRRHYWRPTDGRCPCGAVRERHGPSWLYFDATGQYLGPHEPICTRDRDPKRRMKQLKLF